MLCCGSHGNLIQTEYISFIQEYFHLEIKIAFFTNSSAYWPLPRSLLYNTRDSCISISKRLNDKTLPIECLNQLNSSPVVWTYTTIWICRLLHALLIYICTNIIANTKMKLNSHKLNEGFLWLLYWSMTMFLMYVLCDCTLVISLLCVAEPQLVSIGSLYIANPF